MPSDVTEVTPKKEAGWPHGWQPLFLERLSETGNVSKACRKAKVSRWHAYRTKQEQPDFAQAWQQAIDCATETVLEPEAFRRAVSGVLEPLYYQGKRVGTVRKYSDTLLIVLLKAHAPEKYSERIRAQTTTLNLDVSQLTDEQLDRIAAGEDPAVVLATTPAAPSQG